MFGRPDPFFTTKPHKNSYIESLTRTYPNALPQRDDASFQRALKFRQREKDHFTNLAEENARLRTQNTTLTDDVQKIRELWEQLSKPKTVTDDVHSGASASADGRDQERVEQREQRSGGGKDAAVHDDPDGGRSRSRAVRMEGAPSDGSGADSGGVEGVQSSVLPSERGTDPRGQETEHGPTGSEHGGGIGSDEGVADAGGGVASRE